MKFSRKYFVITFLLLAFVFQFGSNSVLGSEIGLFPRNGDWFPGSESPISWKNKFATAIYPIKFILIKPLSFLGKDEDPAPPILLLAFTLYWSAIAFTLHFLFSLLFKKKKE